jgi:hypothetical protein
MQDAAARESHSRAREELSNPLPVRGRSFSAADVLTALALLSEPLRRLRADILRNICGEYRCPCGEYAP